MGLGIITKQDFEVNSLPIYGNLNFQQNLSFAYRPNGLIGKDLSDSENTIYEAIGCNTVAGYTGFGNNSAKTEFRINSDDLTMIIVGRVINLDRSKPNRSWLSSTYSSDPQSGIGVLITADPSTNGDKFSVKVRTYFTVKNSTTNEFSQRYLPDLIINLAQSSDKTDYFYLVVRINSRVNYIDHQIVNKNELTSNTLAADLSISAAGRNSSKSSPLVIAGRVGGIAETGPANIQQVLVYDRFLDDAEIYRQFYDDKKWLSNEHKIVF